MQWRALLGLSLAACGTETPRTVHPDAGLPNPPFNSYAPLALDDGGTYVPGADAGGDGAAPTAASAEPVSSSAPASSALRAVVPFTIVLRPQEHALRLESVDRQAFTIPLGSAPGALFATKADGLAKGELAHWSVEGGQLEISFVRTSPKLITARAYPRGNEKGARELKFAAPEGATLVVESRP